ncbi:DNA mismatch repair endonuclease MutH [Saccharobesus litoralis]|uniref:DNA mismatch repair protein MutH n=1 Tax=Saccharobesus litoralis TaxID=2172099 RepID=A0A2S0VSC6_9ALTE|nr:DNA mismatch repair endonuclease MutH [Saccharobesus litoralis]AWB67114.1 DNA mismatch repair endonuclease MutH [Saccharobesus litoralis]
MQPIVNEPQSEQELLDRAVNLAGLNLAQLADMAGVSVPCNLQKEKGWAGQLLECLLGAYAGSKPVPDFEHLNIELKTLPISRQGSPLETTYVCVAPLTNVAGLTWQDSVVKKKLSRVLWIPILAERTIPVAERIIGYPLLWSPSAQEEQALQADWEELMEMIALGQIEQITAKHGEVMQIRPKAANASIRTAAVGHHGQPIEALPRGFYLKKNFTQTILRNSTV